MENKGFVNNYPIILVHGFLGWGREEMAGYKYWGGEDDIQAELNDSHYRTYTAVVGPFSSNWERAVELYHYIAGGTVDYGAVHAKKYNIKRYGHTYQGIYSEISDENKVHLVGHSMGGLTIREFETFLREGSKEEREYYKKNPESGISDLFLGGKNWIHSCTSICTPHNSTTVLEQEYFISKIVYPALLEISALSGFNHLNFLYDFKLEQWGLEKERGEYFLEYLDRIMGSSLWDSENTAWFDMTLEGAKRINKRTKTFSDTFYFSFYSSSTFKNLLTGHYLPEITTTPGLLFNVYKIGKYSDENEGFPGDSMMWRPNDGLVNVPSGKYPFGHPYKEAAKNFLKFESGVWNIFPEVYSFDHMQMVGVHLGPRILKRDIIPFYKELAKILIKSEQEQISSNKDNHEKTKIKQSEDEEKLRKKTRSTSKATAKKR